MSTVLGNVTFKTENGISLTACVRHIPCFLYERIEITCPPPASRLLGQIVIKNLREIDLQITSILSIENDTENEADPTRGVGRALMECAIVRHLEWGNTQVSLMAIGGHHFYWKLGFRPTYPDLDSHIAERLKTDLERANKKRLAPLDVSVPMTLDAKQIHTIWNDHILNSPLNHIARAVERFSDLPAATKEIIIGYLKG